LDWRRNGDNNWFRGTYSGSRDGGGCEVGDRGLCNRLVDRNFVSCDASQSAFARFDNLEDSLR
jgi:hypothetical protein